MVFQAMERTPTGQQARPQDTELAKDGVQAIPARVLLIDLDNCPNQIEKLSLHIEEFARVIVSYGGAEPKVPFSLVSLLATPIHEKRLEIVRVEQGKNAADFALTFHAGLLGKRIATEYGIHHPLGRYWSGLCRTPTPRQRAKSKPSLRKRPARQSGAEISGQEQALQDQGTGRRNAG